MHQMGIYEDALQALERATRRETAATIAGRVGSQAALVTRWIKKERAPKLDILGPVLDSLGARLVMPDDPRSLPGTDFTFIPKALARPAAGGGSLETSGEVDGGLVFKRSWLASRTTTNPDSLRIMTVSGDSMTPTFDDGDVILVDEKKRELMADRVYVVRLGDEIFVKRFRQKPGRWLFMGDNRARDYQDLEIDPASVDGFAVIGRVLWAGKEL